MSEAVYKQTAFERLEQARTAYARFLPPLGADSYQQDFSRDFIYPVLSQQAAASRALLSDEARDESQIEAELRETAASLFWWQVPRIAAIQPMFSPIGGAVFLRPSVKQALLDLPVHGLDVMIEAAKAVVYTGRSVDEARDAVTRDLVTALVKAASTRAPLTVAGLVDGIFTDMGRMNALILSAKLTGLIDSINELPASHFAPDKYVNAPRQSDALRPIGRLGTRDKPGFDVFVSDALGKDVSIAFRRNKSMIDTAAIVLPYVVQPMRTSGVDAVVMRSAVKVVRPTWIVRI
jgi:hypothetical protein